MVNPYPNVLAEVRRLFPVTKRFAYLSGAAVAPLPAPARDAMRDLVDDRCARGLRLEVGNTALRLVLGLDDAGGIAEILHGRDAIAAAGRGRSRGATHHVNNGEDVERLLEVLP